MWRFEVSLDMRVRVLAAMTAAREFEAVYVWGAQTGGARRQGVPETTIAAIRDNHSRGIPVEDAQDHRVHPGLVRKHRVDDRLQGDRARSAMTTDPAHHRDRYYSMLAMTGERLRARSGPDAEVAEGLIPSRDANLKIAFPGEKPDPLIRRRSCGKWSRAFAGNADFLEGHLSSEQNRASLAMTVGSEEPPHARFSANLVSCFLTSRFSPLRRGERVRAYRG